MAMNVVPDFKALAKTNKINIDTTGDGKWIPYMAVGKILLIGTGHDQKSAVDFVATSPNHVRGMIKVTKDKGLDRGTLLVTSRGKGEKEIAEAIRLFTKKNIKFVPLDSVQDWT